jgi:asparagine synthase (glutamine-hydrolysing)
MRSSPHRGQHHLTAVPHSARRTLAAAHKVSQALGTQHHEIVYTVEEGIDALCDVIWHIETFDVTTVRASIPMYLMARKIRSQGVKMVMSGEGADEVFGGYL